MNATSIAASLWVARFTFTDAFGSRGVSNLEDRSFRGMSRASLCADDVNLEIAASLYDEAVDDSIDRHASNKYAYRKIAVLN